MPELDLIISELERKKSHLERAIDALRKAAVIETPDERRQRREDAAAKSRRPQASRRGWERRKAFYDEGQLAPEGGAEAA